MVVKLNFNTILVVLGGLGVFSPDVAFIASWLDHLHIHWLSYVARLLGFVAAFFAAAPLAVPKLRAFLALFKLATPAGEVVPHPVPPPPTPPADPANKQGGYTLPDRLLLLLAAALLAIFVWLMFTSKRARADEVTAPSSSNAAAVITTISVPAVTPPFLPVPLPAPAPIPVPTLSPAPSPVPVPTPAPAPAPTSADSPGASAPKPVPSDQITPERPVKWRRPYDSKYGGCRGDFCLAPSVAVQALQYVPSTGEMKGGVAFAGGYGIVWHSIVDFGLAFHAGVQFSRDKPYTAQGFAMFSVANYVAFGPGFEMLGQPSGPAQFHLIICFAANWIPGLVSPK
jgi:hypothetical protein